MPKEKDLKRIVRARMQKTGESYTAARVQTIKKKETAPPAPEPRPDYAALSRVADEALHKNTGRTWPEWVELLDAFGGREKPHRDVAAHVQSLGVSSWWSQSVTVGYERIRGLREVGQRRTGTWEMSKSRTFPVPLATLYEAFANARKRAKWLPGVKLTIRTSIAERSMRITWSDGTDVQVGFTAKGETKSVVAVQHAKLPEKARAAEMKTFWTERFDALAELLS
ncbi:MAG TPA: hypothetical protein VF911_05420 [Thermoanaerobaculia bacterium]|jgi:uncharacterized protein YndB with AHSA1/START domain